MRLPEPQEDTRHPRRVFDPDQRMRSIAGPLRRPGIHRWWTERDCYGGRFAIGGALGRNGRLWIEMHNSQVERAVVDTGPGPERGTPQQQQSARSASEALASMISQVQRPLALSPPTSVIAAGLRQDQPRLQRCPCAVSSTTTPRSAS